MSVSCIIHYIIDKEPVQYLTKGCKMQFPISFSSSSEKQHKALDHINVRGPVVKCWILESSLLNEGLIHCQYCCETVLLSNVKHFYGWSIFFQFFGQIPYRTTLMCTRSFKKSFPSKSYKCLIHHVIASYASIVVMATEYTLDITWCNYV